MSCFLYPFMYTILVFGYVKTNDLSTTVVQHCPNHLKRKIQNLHKLNKVMIFSFFPQQMCTEILGDKCFKDILCFG
jgi:hypothetical protein